MQFFVNYLFEIHRFLFIVALDTFFLTKSVFLTGILKCDFFVNYLFEIYIYYFYLLFSSIHFLHVNSISHVYFPYIYLLDLTLDLRILTTYLFLLLKFVFLTNIIKIFVNYLFEIYRFLFTIFIFFHIFLHVNSILDVYLLDLMQI